MRMKIPQTEQENIDYILSRNIEYRYMMLRRLIFDCESFISQMELYGRIEYCTSHLWAGNIFSQVRVMEAIYNSFDESLRPGDINMFDIRKLAARMKECAENQTPSSPDFIVNKHVMTQHFQLTIKD